MKKKIVFIIILFLLNIGFVNAEERISVTLNKCVDGDTAWFNLNGEKIKTRFLSIDTPESTNKIEEYGKEASKFTCNILTNSKKIEIEYDNHSTKTDKYNRHLVWVFVNNKLLQKEILEAGLGQTKYLYGDYKYIDELKTTENKAKRNKVGMWKTVKKESLITRENIILFLSIIIVITSYCMNKKRRKKINKKIIRKASNKVKNKIDDLY